MLNVVLKMSQLTVFTQVQVTTNLKGNAVLIFKNYLPLIISKKDTEKLSPQMGKYIKV